MPEYKAPLRDIQFVRDELLAYDEHYRTLGFDEASPDIVKAILEEGAKFAEQILAPLNRQGDEQGCRLEDDGTVKTPDGFADAYQQFIESGWPGLSGDPEFGGQGLPESLSFPLSEMNGQANWSWSMYPGLSHGAKRTIAAHGDEGQKRTYLPKLTSGEWTGTMCLTEPHCGTDLGLLRTRAEPQEDGSYKISGTKIFISSGDHDLAENIVHIVLARLPDAPAGTKGISLFIVPKFLPDADGNASERNAVVTGSLEEKMGIHGNATCVLNFDGATGWLIGPPNKGLNCMFTFMNTARVGTALQGVCHAEVALQGAVRYARERLQMRALSGPKAPDKPADPIIVHPDVRRMLLTAKAFAEGGRAMLYYCSKLVDVTHYAEEEDARAAADEELSLLTPIAKGFLTEVGFESAYHGMQVFGGHGFIREWGMEQNLRDARISTLYEGTTGIQAIDLIGRKVLGTQGETLKRFTKVIHKFCQAHEDNSAIASYVEQLRTLNKEWTDLTMKIGIAALEKSPEEVGAAALDYLMYSGYVSLAYFWADMARVAADRLAAGTQEQAFYEAKLQTARFYFERLLPRTRAHVAAIEAGSESLLAMDEAAFLIED